MSDETQDHRTTPPGCAEGVALVHRAQDSGDWRPVAEWLAGHPGCAAEVARAMSLQDRIGAGLAPARAAVSDLTGTTLGGYEVYEKIGKGGMGDVFRGYDPALKRPVAVKVIRTGDPARFRVEAERVAALKHENVLSVYASGESDRGPYLVMPLMARTLDAYRERAGGRLPDKEAAKLVRDVALGVHHAHQRGLIHRDLKPLNVLLDDKGTPKVADFGLARPIDATASVGIAGTYAYMAPEQARGDKGLTTAVDVYALGVTLFELLTARTPFGSGPSALQRVLADPAPPVREFAPEVSRDLEAVCAKCLEKQPEHRYATAQELAEDLDRFLRGEPVRAQPPKFLDWLRQLARTRPEPNPKASWQVSAWMGLATLLGHGAVYALARYGAPAAGIWILIAISNTSLLGILWWYMLRRFRQLPNMDRLSLVHAAGAILAYVPLMLAYVPLSLSVPAREGLGMYPPLALLSGLGWFLLGSTHWSRFFLVGLAIMALAPVMAWWPDEAPLVYGGVVAVALLNLSLAKRGLRVTRDGAPPAGAATVTAVKSPDGASGPSHTKTYRGAE